MGSKIELFRIGLYVFFPVALFYYFNLPDNQDDFIERRKKEIYPPFEETNHPPTTAADAIKYREMLMEAKKRGANSNQVQTE